MILSSPFSRHNKSHQTWHHANGLATNQTNQTNQNSNSSPPANGFARGPDHSPLLLNGGGAPTPPTRHQSNYLSLRKPAPRQPAPDRPVHPTVAPPPPPPKPKPSLTNGYGTSSSASSQPRAQTTFSERASTLNRLDLLKRRQQQQQATSGQSAVVLRRNLSSLGHYPHVGPAAVGPVPPQSPSNGFRNNDERPSEIYAPASIASPREFSLANGTSPGQQQHYASTSVREQPLTSRRWPAGMGRADPDDEPQRQARSRSVAADSSASASGSARPESALGQLWERFGTLRRRASKRWPGRSWSRSSRRSSQNAFLATSAGENQIYAPAASVAGYPISGGRSSSTPSRGARSDTPGGGQAQQQQQQFVAPPSQPLVLDPEVYAKRQPEAEEIYAEGAHAIESNAMRRLLEHELDPQLMEEGETRTLVDELSRGQPDFRQLVNLLTCWINDELAHERIVVRDLQDDLHDGQVLCKLLEHLQGIQLDLVEITQNEFLQRQKLRTVLDILNRLFGLPEARAWARIRWSVDGIHSRNLIEILHLLIAMALLFRAPLRLPPNVSVGVLVFQKHQGELVPRSHRVQLTDEFVATALDQLQAPPLPANQPLSVGHQQRDAFDTLIECAPEAKLRVVKSSLVKFCNRHLARINMTTSPLQQAELDPHQFSDGLLLVFLISSLEDYFVPLGNLFTSIQQQQQQQQSSDQVLGQDRVPVGMAARLPYIDANNNSPLPHQQPQQQQQIGTPTAIEPTSFINCQPIEKLHNVNVALQLMEDAGLADIRQRVRAEEIVNGDLKAILRVLYALFSRYKHL